MNKIKLEVKTGCDAQHYNPILAITKLNTYCLGYIGSDKLFHANDGTKYNYQDVIAYIDITPIEDKFKEIYNKYYPS